jgi:hypothetical protein
LEALSYVTDSVTVRVMPYARVGLIGIPYMHLKHPRGKWAIAHEVGHSRYWSPFSVGGTELESFGYKVSPNETMMLNVRELYFPFSSTASVSSWSEELFADTYAVLVGGTLAIPTAMDVAIEHSAAKFSKLDFEDPHPTPLIRPLLMIKALTEMSTLMMSNGNPLLAVDLGADASLWQFDANKVEQLSIALFNRWKRCLIDRHLLREKPGAAQPVKDESDIVTEFVDPILYSQVRGMIHWESRTLIPDLPIENLLRRVCIALSEIIEREGSPKFRWGWENNTVALSTDLSGISKTRGQIDQKLKEKIKARQEASEPPADKTESENSAAGQTENVAASNTAIPDYSNLWRVWLEDKRYLAGKPSEIWAGAYETAMDPKNRPTNTWLPVFGAGGWTTEGPCNFPPG